MPDSVADGYVIASRPETESLTVSRRIPPDQEGPEPAEELGSQPREGDDLRCGEMSR